MLYILLYCIISFYAYYNIHNERKEFFARNSRSPKVFEANNREVRTSLHIGIIVVEMHIITSDTGSVCTFLYLYANTKLFLLVWYNIIVVVIVIFFNIDIYYFYNRKQRVIFLIERRVLFSWNDGILHSNIVIP